MTAHTKGSGMTWVGRALRRVEDPALVTGQGRFTADLPAAHWVRFLRSPAAAGKIATLKAPDGALVITAADLVGVKPILPMLHKFEYKPLGQPILADGEVRFVGEPVAAVVAASEEEAEDIADYAVGLGTGHLREGATGTTGNRFLQIERELGSRAQFLGRRGFKP